MLLRLLHLLRWVGRRELSKASWSRRHIAVATMLVVGAVVIGAALLGDEGQPTLDDDTGLGEEATRVLLQDIGYLK